MSGEATKGLLDLFDQVWNDSTAVTDVKFSVLEHNHMEMEKISRLMGHKSARTTKLYYCRVSEREVIDDARDKW